MCLLLGEPRPLTFRVIIIIVIFLRQDVTMRFHEISRALHTDRRTHFSNGQFVANDKRGDRKARDHR
jgi:hypothetical protein